MTIPNLPPLRSGAEFPVQPVVGKWTRADGTLKQLGRALRVTTDKPFRDPDEPIRAIPDAWAQARMFGDALRDAKHSMHGRVTTQWRGLLALFALQSFYDTEYKLEARQVDLSGPHVFDRVLSTLPPEISIHGQGAEWGRPWIILVHPTDGATAPLGLTNPICLVSPGRQSHAIRIHGVAWAQGDLGDPLALPPAHALPAPQIITLHDWLVKVREDLRIFTGEVASDLRQALADYIEACRRELGNGVTLKARVGDSIRTEMPVLFRSLFRPATIEGGEEPWTTSQTILRLRDGLSLGKLRGIILADPGLLALPGVNPRTMFVWGTTTLADVLRTPAAFTKARDEAAQAGYWLVSGAELFTARAVRLANNPMIASHPAGLQDMLIPLRPLALLLAGSPRDTATAQSDGRRVAVTLGVALARPGGDDLPVPLTRHYAVEPGDNEGLLVTEADWDITNASLWPDFRSSAWNRYFLRFLYDERRKGNMARPLGGISPDLFLADLAANQTAQETISRAQALNDRAPLTNVAGRFVHSERLREQVFEALQVSALPFEAIAYSEAQGARTAAFGGMVLLDLPLQEPTAAGTAAAIDFGTTNTVVCLAGSAEPLVFQKRLVVPIRFRNPEVTQATMHAARRVYTDFLPHYERHMPTPTVAIGRGAHSNDADIWVFRNLIYFHWTEQYAANDESQEIKRIQSNLKDLKFNLKWSSDSRVIEAASDFLEQIMVMTAAEILAAGYDPRRTRWLFSVPDAISEIQRKRFEDHLTTVAAGISSAFIGGETDGRKETALAPLQSEGLSAARYMITAAGFNADALNIVLDIGGGTTDITIWERYDLRWQGSFLIAGQNFFTRLLCANPKILHEIGLASWARLFEANGDAWNGTQAGEASHVAELLFSGDSRDASGLNLQRAMAANWSKRLNADVGDVLRGTALTFLGGLAWYIGRVVRTLVAEGRIAPSSAAEPAFALCGRGAGLFRMMHGENRREDERTAVTRTLQVYDVAAGLTDRPRPEVRLTPMPKLEVVRGMLISDDMIDAAVKDEDHHVDPDQVSHLLPAGLSVTYRSGDPVGPDDPIGPQSADRQPDKVDLAEFDLFLTELEKSAGLKVDLFASQRSGARRAIESTIIAELERARRDKNANRAPEPPFVTALRALVGELAAPPDKREGRIGMVFEQ
jgi:hypothetical protein